MADVPTTMTAQDKSLAAVARKLATELLADEAVKLAQAAAEKLAAVVITDTEEAGRVADLTKAVKNGGSGLKRALDAVCKPFKDAVDEARDVVHETLDTLSRAERIGREKLTAWQEHQEKLRRAEERKAREEAEKAKADLAQQLGVRPDEVPAVEVSLPPPPKIETRRSQAGLTKVLACELYDARECPWLVLDEVTAKREFRDTMLKEGAVQLPDESIVWKGVRYYYKHTTAIR